MKHIICNSYKKELLSGMHQLHHEYKLALYDSTKIGTTHTTSYFDFKNEISGNGYPIGGITIQPFIVLDKDVAILSFKNIIIPHCTLEARWALLYNNTLADKNAISIIDFETTLATENGDFVIMFPDANKKDGFIKII